MGPYDSAASSSKPRGRNAGPGSRPFNRVKHRKNGSTSTSTTKTITVIPQTAYIQAYEAQLVYDAPERAREVVCKDSKGGRGLMRWQGEFVDEGHGGEIWADRHDILHLLTSLPTASTSRAPVHNDEPPSPALTSSSWDSLPSDLEETFFLSGTEEIEEYERCKKRAWMDALREERLKERAKEDGVREKEAEERKGKGREPGWGDDGEEPPDPILTLMTHTATSLLSSPNPSLLELRILANHASDPRFEFIRGRYKTTWERLKADARRQRDIKSGKAGQEKKVFGALLGGYESSDDDDEDENEHSNNEGDGPLGNGGTPPPPPGDEDIPSPPSPPPPPPDEPVDDKPQHSLPILDDEAVEKQRLKRIKLDEWKRKRAEQAASKV